LPADSDIAADKMANLWDVLKDLNLKHGDMFKVGNKPFTFTTMRESWNSIKNDVVYDEASMEP